MTRPTRCPKCHRPVTLVNVTRMTPHTILESCHVCGHGLAIVRRNQTPRVRPQDRPAARGATQGPSSVSWPTGIDLGTLDEEHRGSLAATGPRTPGPQLVADIAERTGWDPTAFACKRRIMRGTRVEWV